MNTIVIRVAEPVAQRYAQAPEETRRKIQLLLNLWLREVMMAREPLPMVMDRIAQRARERGLTAERLQRLLNDDADEPSRGRF